MDVKWVVDTNQDRLVSSQVDSGGIIQLIDTGSGWEIYVTGCLGSPIAIFHNLENAQGWAERLIQVVIAAHGPREGITEQTGP
jgi:hypothetical protein